MNNITDRPTTIELVPTTETVITNSFWQNGSFWQMLRFGMVGCVNTLIDILIFNILLFFIPTHEASQLLVYNSLAYALGAFNSFLLNKYWTFRHKEKTTGNEVLRFACINGFGILCNDVIIWLAARLVHPAIMNAVVWANASKIVAILGTFSISYLGMRLWVFVNTSQPTEEQLTALERKETLMTIHNQDETAIANAATSTLNVPAEHNKPAFLTHLSLSVILPSYNEEKVIAKTITSVIEVLTPWVKDFTVVVVDDGSKDQTATIVEGMMASDSRVRLIQHPINQGYGAALVSGFEAVTTDLAFFTDSDGQFDISDLKEFFPLIDQYDAVLGYRIDRQDTTLRKLNAWGWKMLVCTVFGFQVRDVDCAFKLYHTDFFRQHTLETRGAMINTEILYKLKRHGYTFTQVGVRHLPRTSGKATGAKPAVILRALQELFTYAKKWHQEEKAQLNLLEAH